MRAPWQWGVSSNEQAVANARAATTALSRRRVEREDVELYLRTRHAAPAPALDAHRVEVAR
ncbi:hypothetical protein [Nocardioides euryhalodurans]|uniref:Uncharacterized protein n=1 Tax=Nocardioides euryhalodurans TaxID=2518370 RepID=A0A4P7GGB8_9ACTN|nr:hypothetical protein [Nocardioides euryhalodurans]QBR90890.1 hypothetical protein EXE57_00345 [Nocardioides euryhalodurans]